MKLKQLLMLMEIFGFKRARVGKFLDLRHIDTSVEGLDKREIRTRNDFDPNHATGWSGPKDQQNKIDIFLSKRGLLYVINQCRKPTHNLKILAEVDFHRNKWSHKEQDTLRQIMEAFSGEEMIHQFSAGKYRIDLYFPKYKLTIERDEFDHCDRDIGYEVER